MSCATAGLKRLFLALLLVLACLPVKASSPYWDSAKVPLRVVLSGDSSTASKQFIDALRSRWPSSFQVGIADDFRTQQEDSVYLVVGPQALKNLLAIPGLDGAVVAVYITSNAYREFFGLVGNKRVQLSAVYIDPTPRHQIALIASIWGRGARVSVLTSEKTAYLVPLLRQAASEDHIDLLFESVGADEDLNRILNRISGSKALLAVPDGTIYSPENTRSILLTTYRHMQPVIGFSQAFVGAGALASTFSTPADIADQVVELLESFRASGRLPEPQFPKYFSTVVNENVARSLNLVIEDGVRQLAKKRGVAR